MQAVLYIIFGVVFACWIVLVLYMSERSDRLRKVKGFEDRWSYRDFVRVVKQHPTAENIKVLNDLKATRVRLFLLWFATLIGAAVLMIAFGVALND